MKLVPFGSTGVMVSQMCLGTMMFGERCDEKEADRIVAAALDYGVTFLDTASVYAAGQTEEILGRILRGRRDRVFLATKVNVPKGTDYPSQIGPSLDTSLRRLQTDHVDLCLLHWPRPGMDPPTILRALGEAVRTGKTRFVGCCNFPAWLLGHFNTVAQAMGAPRLINNQVPYNLIERGVELEVLPQAQAEDIALTCYRPLMEGVLTGKYVPGRPIPTDARAVDDDRIPTWVASHEAGLQKLIAVAKTRHVPPVHLAIAWLTAQPAVTCPIIGVSRLEQVAVAVAALGFELSSTERTELAAAFGTEVKEVSQYYGPLRRAFGLAAT